MTSYSGLIKRIQELQANYREAIQPPCPPAQLDLLKRRLREELGFELPAAYEEFLLISNGLDWNGMVLFSAGYEMMAGEEYCDIQDMMFPNLVLHEGGRLESKLLLGDSGMDFYIHDFEDGHAAIIDSIGRHEYETFPSVYELLDSVLRNSLKNFDD